MKENIVKLINELKEENDIRSKKLNTDMHPQTYSNLVHLYNHTLGIIKKLEKIALC